MIRRAAGDAPLLGVEHPPIAVTGLGVVSPIGVGCDAFWSSIERGEHGFRRLDRLATPELATRCGALLPAPLDDLERLAAELGPSVDPSAAVALVAAREAWQSAHLGTAPIAPQRTALVLGTAAAGLWSRSRYESLPVARARERHHLLAASRAQQQTAYVATALGVAGPRLTVATACASSTHALAHGRDLLLSRTADAVIAGGVDVLVEELAAGFAAMEAMSPGPCAPFSEPFGMSLGEGAGFVVLERLDDARARRAKPWCELAGYGASADAYHATAPDPSGAGLARAMRAALDDAGRSPADIGYVNAHGTGTESNDAAEWRAIVQVLGERAHEVPVSSTKSFFGHALGAAGILEAAATVLALRQGVVPPTLHFTGPRRFGPRDPVAGDRPRPHAFDHALTCNAAFGGANAVLVLSRLTGERDLDPRPNPRTTPAAAAPRRLPTPPVGHEGRLEEPRADPVVVLGWGLLAGHGSGDLRALLQEGEPVWAPLAVTGARAPLPAAAALVPEDAMRAALQSVNTRGMDRASRLLTGAARLAMQHAGLRMRAALRARTGLIVGAHNLAWDSADDFWDSVRERGMARASAPAFARIVTNAPAGAASRALSLRGPLSVLAEGSGAALRATCLAHTMLGYRGDTDVLLVGSVLDLGRGLLEDVALIPEAPCPGEVAACVALARESFARAHGLSARCRVATFGWAGPQVPEQAVWPCLEAAKLHGADVPAVFAAGYTAELQALEDAALAAALGSPAPGLAVERPSRVLGGGESADAAALVAACAALDAPAAPPDGARSTRAALVLAADAVAGATSVLLV